MNVMIDLGVKRKIDEFAITFSSEHMILLHNGVIIEKCFASTY